MRQLANSIETHVSIFVNHHKINYSFKIVLLINTTEDVYYTNSEITIYF